MQFKTKKNKEPLKDNQAQKAAILQSYLKNIKSAP